MSFPKNIFSVFYILLFLIIGLIGSSCRSHKEVAKSSENEHLNASESVKIQNKYGQLLSIDPGNIENLKLYRFIDDWYGTPYKYGGKNKEGMDCSNFAIKLYADVYNRSITGCSSSIFNQCEVVSKLAESDFVFFKIGNDSVSHMGVYLQNNKFVHETTKKGVMIDDLDEPYYKKYFFKAGRLKVKN